MTKKRGLLKTLHDWAMANDADVERRMRSVGVPQPRLKNYDYIGSLAPFILFMLLGGAVLLALYIVF